MSMEERIGRLGTDERAMLANLNKQNLICFRVTVTVSGCVTEQINVIAPHACNAVTMAMELMFPDFDSVKPTSGIQIKAEPVRAKSRMAVAA